MAHGNDLKTSQEDAARKRQKYQLAFEQSRDAFLFFEGECFQDCNPATLAMFRVPDVATFVTLHPAELSPPYQPDGRSSREAAADRFDEALSQGQAFFEWRHRTWDGVDFPAEVLLSRVDLEEGPLVQAVVRDISDRKEAEDALRSREQELAEAQRLVHLGSWISDFRTNEIRWSDEVYRIFGLNREEWAATLESFMAAVHPDDRAKVQAALEASFRGEPYEVDHRIMRPDGEVRTVLERGHTELDADGKPLRMFGTIQDITEQRRLEDELRNEKTLSESIVDGLPGIFYMLDGQGRLVRWNDRVVEVTGRNPEEMQGTNALEFIPEQEQPLIAKYIRKTFEEGSTVVESKLRTVAGDVPYLFSGLRTELDGEPYVLGISLDISKQKYLEALLEREATTDHLTGLYNRQRFDAEMEWSMRWLGTHAMAMKPLW
ncbi:PAS domain S-box protein [Guyparkeria sp. GHLCS8-2]|uniref:PAS domain-containing protein n=1 Tax=Guyparkeria halopsychrophila TaxID=3139421 RepID=UPI0037C61EAA